MPLFNAYFAVMLKCALILSRALVHTAIQNVIEQHGSRSRIIGHLPTRPTGLDGNKIRPRVVSKGHVVQPGPVVPRWQGAGSETVELLA